MAIKKISDHPDLDLVGKFVCSTSTDHPVAPARVQAVEGTVLVFSPLTGGEYDPVLGCRRVLPVVSNVVGRRKRYWTDLACDTAEEAVAVWRQAVVNRRAVEELARTSRDNLVRAAVAGELLSSESRA